MVQLSLASVNRSLAVAAAAALAAAALSACSSSQAAPGNDSETPVPSASVSPSKAGTEVKVDATLRSVYNRVDEVGPEDANAYGVNVLEGLTKINDRTVRVRMLGTFDLTESNGSVGGFVELIWTDGTKLAFRQTGEATRSGRNAIDYKADLTVINGSRDAEGISGNGSWTGARKPASSTSVSFKAVLDLVNAPEFVTGVRPPKGGTAAPTESYSATIAP